MDCGNFYTSKMEGMIRDADLWSELDSDYQSFLGTTALSFVMSCKILTLTFWPTENYTATFEFPEQLKAGMEAFEKFYSKRHDGRKLTWCYYLGTMDLVGINFGKRMELNVPVVIGAILLLFNAKEGYTVEEITNALGLSDSYIGPYLSLIKQGKFNILSQENGVYHLNQSFSLKTTKAKIPFPSFASSKEKEVVNESIRKDRRFLYPFSYNIIFLSHARFSYS